MSNPILRGPTATYLLGFGLLLGSCTDLDVEPQSTATPNVLFADANSYDSFIARVYSGLAVTGQEGPAGQPDISSLDEGFSSYLRQYWQLQELPTDEAVIGWGDAGLPELSYQSWSGDNQFVRAMYYRIYYQVSIANEFLRESTDELLAERNIGESRRRDIAEYRAEARFLRALSLYHALDLFGSAPLYTETQAIGGAPPPQASSAELFGFLEAELREIRSALPAAGSVTTARATGAAADLLLSRLYLNAAVYVGQDRYADALTAAERVIDAGEFGLEPNYANLFNADNDRSGELIFAIPFDGDNTRTWGGTTFLVHASIGGSMAPEAYGVNSGWAGLRATEQFVDLFDDPSGDTDRRAIFYTDGQSLEVAELSAFANGYAVPKWTNVASDGTAGKDVTFPDTDFPVFRLAEAYLNYAEAAARGAANADRATAVGYVNLLRARAYGNDSGAIGEDELTADFILAERGRELYWEGHRRTDLRRHARFTGDAYVWAWKGGSAAGGPTPEFLELYPLPASEIIANPELTQNPGY